MTTDQISKQLHTRFPTLEENASLAKYSTYRIGGPARFLLLASSSADVVDALGIIRTTGVPVVILGGGSNVLIADTGFPGLVIIMRLSRLIFSGDMVTAEAGVKLSVLLVLAATHGLGGLDFLIGVPGTVGGAIYGNAGSRAEAIGDRIEKVTLVDARGNIQDLLMAECQFSYRMSRFKSTKEVILSADLRLPPGDTEELHSAITTRIRWKNQHQPTHDQSAGCVFQNVSIVDPTVLPADLRGYVIDGQLSAWRIVAAAGLQGKRMGGVQVSPVHANFIVNTGAATSEDVIILISYIKQQVRDRFGIQLYEEVQLIGFKQP